MTKVTEEYLDEREQLHKNATKGPWINPDGYCVRKVLPKDSGDQESDGEWKTVCRSWCYLDQSIEEGYNNMEFIADAHESMPVLINEIKRLRELLSEVAKSGVEWDHKSNRWLTVQIGRDTWEALQEFK